MIRITNILVVFNQSLQKSPSFRVLSTQVTDSEELLVVDNSTDNEVKKTNQLLLADNPSIQYLDMEGNVGLSVAYNRAFELLDAKDWAVLWDQDTEVPANFISKVVGTINGYPNELMVVPFVDTPKLRMSPRKHSGPKITGAINEVGVYEDITAINSGMAIRVDAFRKNNGYDESMFLDYIDHDFVIRFTKSVGSIVVNDNLLKQSFSDENHDNIDGDIFRFKIYYGDFKQFCAKFNNGSLFFVSKIWIRAFKLSKIYKNTRFIKIVMQGGK